MLPIGVERNYCYKVKSSCAGNTRASCINSLTGIAQKDINCFANKLYHFWSVLARGVFFVLKKERNDMNGKEKEKPAPVRKYPYPSI